MPQLAPPSPQTAGARPISFLLDDRAGIGAPVELLTLFIRPESLTRQDPTRLVVQQTLGGAWTDSFGAGLPTINIQGHTGWRRTAGSSDDGEARFMRLRSTVFDQWHSRRAEAIKRGIDPNEVRLMFVDALDNFVCTVAPQTFALSRSRSRPLLMQYQIQLIVLSDTILAAGAPANARAQSPDVLRSLGLDSLADGIDKIEALAKDLTSFIDKEVAGPMKGFMDTTNAIFKRVNSAVQSVDGVASSLIGVAQTAAKAGSNMARTANLVLTLPQRAQARMTQIAAAYHGLFCLLNGALKNATKFDAYDDVYGASGCSSTSGGRPLSANTKTNTWAAVLPTKDTGGIKVSGDAQSALRTLAQTDVVLSPLPRVALVRAIKSVNQGLVLE